jgi:hypothetical protein
VQAPTIRPLSNLGTSLPPHLIRFLQAQSARLKPELKKPRPWHYGGLHNPWGRAAPFYDTWGFLDICQFPMLLHVLATLIGPDIILFDSQWLPDPWQLPDVGLSLESDAHRFPVQPLRGVTVLVCFAAHRDTSTWFDCRPTIDRNAAGPCDDTSVRLEPGTVLIADSQLQYRLRVGREVGAPVLYAIRYFPATSRYNRSPAAPAHRALTERYPFFNYARLPLWLVHGCDRADNDFVTGFNLRTGYWTNASW